MHSVIQKTTVQLTIIQIRMIQTRMVSATNATTVQPMPMLTRKTVMATATEMQVSLLPFAVTIMVAASASFATPIGYQTNLMVYGPGGYKFTDFVKIGIPLSVVVGVITIILAPLVWPF